MTPAQQANPRNKRKIILSFMSILVIIAVSILGLLLFFPPKLPNRAAFDQEITLQTRQAAIIGSGEDMITFRFTEMKPPEKSIDPASPHILMGADASMFPRLYGELEYAGKKMKGTLLSTTGSFEFSYHENGAYPLIPYDIQVLDVDFAKHIGTIKITQKKFTKIELGAPFTLKDDGVAALVPGKTGVHVNFGICGFDSPCAKNLEFWVDDEYVNIPHNFRDSGADPERQFVSKEGAAVEHGNLRLRLIKTDDHTYATFVLENS